MRTKKEIRQEIYKRRAAHSDAEIAALSQKVMERVVRLPAFQDAEKIYIYIGCNHEVGTETIIEEAWKQGKQVAVPKVEGREMSFYLLERFDQLRPGYFQIPEPIGCKRAEWDSMGALPEGLMIMPGVAFDLQRNRCGYGGGFYDRFLQNRSFYKLALAFEFQIVAAIPSEPTDQRPDRIVTEDRVL